MSCSSSNISSSSSKKVGFVLEDLEGGLEGGLDGGLEVEVLEGEGLDVTLSSSSSPKNSSGVLRKGRLELRLEVGILDSRSLRPPLVNLVSVSLFTVSLPKSGTI